ncbi:unnamed protein product [Arabis nemorensis]|uniref:Uncharacterized protein n=1 Tax=Arabis nemorensis TaxID=586526 RepID=A0A565AMG7_9BRAS|nr:unnamed protein product [Arabis nemorensis]
MMQEVEEEIAEISATLKNDSGEKKKEADDLGELPLSATSNKGKEKKRLTVDERRIKNIDKKLKKEKSKVLEAESTNEFLGGLISSDEDVEVGRGFKSGTGNSRAKKRKLRALNNAAKKLANK